MRRKNPGAKGKKVPEITNYVQDFINIKDIRAGIIETKDKRYLKIIEIEPINFNLRSEEEKTDIISSFYSFFKVSNIKLQFKSMTFKADSQKHINTILNDLQNEDNKKTIELGQNYINFVQDFGAKNAFTRRFFIIIEESK